MKYISIFFIISACICILVINNSYAEGIDLGLPDPTIVSSSTYSFNSDKLDGYDYDHFVDTATADSTYLGINDKSDDADKLDGYNYDHFVDTATAESTYLGINDKADDADKLDGYNYDHFVDTTTAQSIGGDKTFTDNINVNGDIDIGDVGGFSGIKFETATDRIVYWINGSSVSYVTPTGEYVDLTP